MCSGQERHADHLERLSASGIDVDGALASGQFEVKNNSETYLRAGRFDPDLMLEAFEQLASRRAEQGFLESHRLSDGLGRGPRVRMWNSWSNSNRE